MARTTVNNGDTGLVARTAINDNFTELYNATAINGVSEIFNDWLTPLQTNFVLTSLGTGSTSLVGNADFSLNQLGIIGIHTGTTETGHTAISLSLGSIPLGIGVAIFETRMNLVTNLSDGTNSYIVHLGFGDSLTAAPTDGAFFRYTHSNNSGKWEAVTVSDSVETATDTGIAATITTNRKFKVVVNALGTSVNFYIDDVLVATNTTNIPTGAGRGTGYITQIRKTLGTTSRYIIVDYNYFKYELTSPR